ncbi:LOW QUALITY PROTEIN: ras association domain-containing protein 8 [Bacillus rossius redtenbacheri]|uniref:LOW QUALITY PROTEIN: ras association domain-containing protein 8 n=1 Tax=Bacillus rossius redtenbacheri TaxID=93214 RepID=UPI002FDDD66F
MELKVWVDGIQRIVCGVTENTTCQDVVYALAHATGKTGRFTLIERWRNNERLLAPHEHPLKILTKWGEYSSDVQFILQRSASRPQPGLTPTKSPPPDTAGPDRNKDIRKSLTFSGGHQGWSELRRREDLEVREELVPRSKEEKGSLSPGHQEGYRSPARREAPPYREPPSPTSPPPYRDPPPPTSSPSRGTPEHTDSSSSSSVGKSKLKRNLIKDYMQAGDVQPEGALYSNQYRDLVRLINYQRQKLSAQQAELTKYDAEIVFWEGKTREQQMQIDFLSQEIARIEAISHNGEEQLRQLSGVEEESEIVRQQEKTLKSELTLLRSKLANCETELLQCKNKIRLLLEELQAEQRCVVRESEDRQSLERATLGELERLQHELDQAKHGTEAAAQCGDSLQREVAILEAAIAEKKRQVERLVSDMKEANLQSLAVAPAEELKHLLEGPHKPGSTRKMIGSPRQLENAVPTSKNPHGVWV